MGVHGLWKLIESAGKPVPVETLENKVLAVDVSIWLHQLMKGYQNPSGSSVSNAYLLGLFTRVCKLLFTNVKPIFVFDGGVPQLKRKTIAARQKQKDKAVQASEKLREQLLKNLLKQKAVSQVLEEIRGQSSPKKKAPDMYELPPLPEAEDSPSDVEEMSNSSSEEDVKPIKMKYKDLHTIDVKSAEFKGLPADIRHDILSELKETRKQNSWGRIHEMPEESGDFSKYQMSRLLKRRSVQVSLEEAEKEMGGRTLSVADVEALLAEGGVEINPQLSKRIASDDVTRYIYVRETGEQSESSQNVNCAQSANIEKEESSVKIVDSVPDIKIKEEVIDIDELSDAELIREVETIETIRGEVEAENVEYGTEDMFENESSSEGVIIDDMDLVKDNSGLSQDQILAVIKQENVDKTQIIDHLDDNVPSTSKEDTKSGVENLPKNILYGNKELNRVLCEDKAGDLPQTHESSESKILDSLYFKMNRKLQSILSQKAKIKKPQATNSTVNLNKGFKHNLTTGGNNKMSVKSVDLSALASNSSDSEIENSHDLPCEISTVVLPNTKCILPSKTDFKIESSNKEDAVCHLNNTTELTMTQLSSSESDNDFIEVSPSKELHSPAENNKNSQGLHIEIKSTQDPIENDIFADIFLDKVNENSKSKNEEISVLKNKQTLQNRDKKTRQEDKEIVEREGLVINQNIRKTDELLELNVTPDIKGKNENLNTSHSYSGDSNKINLNNDETSEIDEHQSSLIYTENQPEYSEDSEDVDNPSPKPGPSSSDALIQDEVPKRKLDEKQLEKLQDILETKEREIVMDHNREDRLATSITDQMYQEAQELLRLFGVPYVVAPMEAEAQCAFMDSAGMTQGTITDDSDIWLFGGRKVYKNFFDQKKFVLEFQANDIQHYFKLNRGHLVLLALLVGSDYTVGLQGVGPVTALEILATFPPSQVDPKDSNELINSLNHFKQWRQSQSHTYAPLAKKLKNVDVHEGFPSPAVVSAYLQPLVDESREPFSWGSPDLSALRDYAERKFGWNRNRTDQILLPVVNKLSSKTSQLTLHTFFGAIPNVSAHREQMSRRVQSAVNRLEGGNADFEPVQPRQRQPRSRGRGRAAGINVAGPSGQRGRGRSRNPLDDDEQHFLHESVGKTPEVIPQREKDRQEAVKRKQQAIDIMKKNKVKRMKKRKNVRQEKPEANLSESSSDDN